MKTKAVIKLSSGYLLVIPKSNNAPLLFLEWVANFRAGCNMVHKVIDNHINEEGEALLKIRLNTGFDGYQNCCDYINNNL